MLFRLAVTAVVLSLPASAQGLDAANRYFQERSYSRACDAYTAALKGNANPAREAQARKAIACTKSGKGGWEELRKLGREGEKDFARALAAHALYERGELSFDQVSPLLKSAGTAEATRLLQAALITELDRNQWYLDRTEALAKEALATGGNADYQAQVRLRRARARLQQSKQAKEAEAELRELGNGSTDVADDALYSLAERRRNAQQLVEALSLYDEIAKRFNGTTSNVYDQAKQMAASIRAPQVSLSVLNNELPGVKPAVLVNFQNVKNATWTLKKTDPFAQTERWPGSPEKWTGSTIKTWKSTLQETSRHANTSTQFDLDVKEPGFYALEVNADGQVSHAWALVSRHITVTESSREEVLVAVFDAETGEVQPGAEVSLVAEGSRQQGKTGADGLLRLKVKKADVPMLVFTRKDNQYTWAPAGNVYTGSWNREQLAYVMTDRPLYKPGETVGLKLFLRSREGGPSAPLANTTATVTVWDPGNKELAKETLTTNSFGTAAFSLTLPPKAALGSYRMYVQSSGTSFTQSNLTFRVEEYKPPEYTVSVEPLGNPRPGDVVKFKVKAAYYSGGAIANATGRALVTVSPAAHRFPAWPDEPTDSEPEWGGYNPYRHRRYYPGYGWQLASQTIQFKTGADGTAEVEVPVQNKDQLLQHEQLTYNVQVFVTDASRREIQGSGKVNLSKRDYFVDIKSTHLLYKPGERVTVKLRAEDANGRPVDADVALKLVKLQDDGKTTRVAEVRTRIVKGTGTAVLDADAIGPARVEVRSAKDNDDALLASTDLWLTSDKKPMVPGPGFQLLVDRAPLDVGSMVRVLVAGGRSGGHALVTLEADTIAHAQTVALIGRARFVEIRVPAGIAPNGWVSAVRVEDTQLRQHRVELRVRGSEVELPVKVSLGAATTEPGTQLTAAVSARNANTALKTETALTIVDEALFAIEPERTDFLSFFGRTRRQHGVTINSSVYNRRTRPRAQAEAEKKKQEEATAMPITEPAPERQLAEVDDFGGGAKALADSASTGAGRGLAAPAPAMKSAKREAAGPGAPRDEAPGQDPVKVRQDFATSSGWFAQLQGTLHAATEQRFTLKDTLTSWKATATLVTEGPLLGQGSAKVRTSKPLMVRLQAPRFFIEGDEVVLSAIVESHLPDAATLDVSIDAPGFTALTPVKQTLRVEPNQTQRFDATFKVGEPGERTLRATVRSGKDADAMEWKLPVLVHGSAQRQFFAGRVKATQSVKFELPQKRKAALTQVEVTLTPTVLSTMLDALPYLAAYPYGCVEQTLSRFVPAVIAQRTVKDLNLPMTRVPKELPDMTAQGLERLYSFQHGDGGWGWWQHDSTNLWMTAYVVSSLSLARDAGLQVRADVITRGRDYLKNHLGAGLNNPETHAYMVYALASTGDVPKAAVNTVYSRRTKLPARARAQLALSLLHLKDPRARVAVENLDDVVKAASSRADASVGEANDAWSTSAAIEATAFTLMAYTRYDPKSALIGPLTDFLVLRRNGGRWRNTRDTAFAVYALAELAKRENAANSRGTFIVNINGKEAARAPYTNGGVELTEPLRFTDSAFTGGENVITVQHDGGGTGYFGITADVFNMNDFIKGVGGDVKVKRSYTVLGRPATDKPLPVGAEYGMPVESGTRVRVDLELTANKAVEFVMLEDLKPAGFEVVLQKSGPEVCGYRCAHAELRTDRVAMFLSSIPVGTTKLSYEVRAEVPGKFSALPARAEAMYAPEIQATADEMRFQVRDEPPGEAAK